MPIDTDRHFICFARTTPNAIYFWGVVLPLFGGVFLFVFLHASSGLTRVQPSPTSLAVGL